MYRLIVALLLAAGCAKPKAQDLSCPGTMKPDGIGGCRVDQSTWGTDSSEPPDQPGWRNHASYLWRDARSNEDGTWGSDRMRGPTGETGKLELPPPHPGAPDGHSDPDHVLQIDPLSHRRYVTDLNIYPEYFRGDAGPICRRPDAGLPDAGEVCLDQTAREVGRISGGLCVYGRHADGGCLQGSDGSEVRTLRWCCAFCRRECKPMDVARCGVGGGEDLEGCVSCECKD
jgi:hypothetical protein